MTVMPFSKTRAGNRPRSDGAVSRVMPETFSGILNRQPMLNYAKGRSLSGQRAFVQGGKHAPDRGKLTEADILPSPVIEKSENAVYIRRCSPKRKAWL